MLQGNRKRHRAGRATVTGVAVGLSVVLLTASPAAADVIKGNGNGNTLNGTAGADTMYGYDGRDTLYGRGGNDTMYGGKKADKLYGGRGSDTGYGNRGDDYMYGGAGSGADKMYGGPHADTINGGAGPDVLVGGDGHDRLRGADGGDRLRARDGTRDYLTCGAGKDTAIMDNYDLITDTSTSRRKGSCESVRWYDPWRLPLPRNSFGGRDELDDPHWSSTPAIDLQVPNGTQVYAVRGGHVMVAGWGVPDWCGKGVQIAGVSGGVYWYCHLDSVSTTAGQGVPSGARIGRTGETGNTSGPHLHFAITVNGVWKCPQRMLLQIWDNDPVPVPRDLPSSGCTRS